MIVTIDGPAGAGKSTLAIALAKRLGFEFLDTGALYRAVAYLVLQTKVDPQDPSALGELMSQCEIQMLPGRILVNGEEATAAIRTPEVTKFVRHVADKAIVRDALTRMQREIASGGNYVTEGRDQGTVAFPDARCKFFLTASEQARAERRLRDFTRQGIETTLQQVLDDQLSRDRVDSERELAPLVAAADAIHVDSSNLSVEQVLELMEEKVRLARG